MFFFFFFVTRFLLGIYFINSKLTKKDSFFIFCAVNVALEVA